MYAVYDGHAHDRSPSHKNAAFRHELVLAAAPGGANITRQARVLLPVQTDSVSHSSLACGLVVLSGGQVVALQHHMRLGPGAPEGGKLREVGGTLEVYSSGDGGHTLDSIASFGEVHSAYNYTSSRGVTGALAVDPGSARWRDRVYAVWADYASGRGAIRVRTSSDAGRSWTPQSTVAPSTDDAPDRFMPTVAVNRSGVVGVLWYERTPGATEGHRPLFSASRDGGVTWLPPVPLTSAMNVRAQQRGTSTGTFLPNGGDTAGLVADATGRFHAVWIDNRTGVQQAWAATIDVARR
jgi:hypothetical protein